MGHIFDTSLRKLKLKTRKYVYNEFNYESDDFEYSDDDNIGSRYPS